ncbi:MAG TPA: PEP/pyruvate-binding domain-containing protein [Mycobacteriales bacterium]|nr:PEP/pyruvate-binding domain-containing protein [Mycobacteriales bacterium]
MRAVLPLPRVHEVGLYGAKAVGLGEAARAGLPVPPGVALPGPFVEAISSSDRRALRVLEKAIASLPGPLAVRSSGIDEDGAEASFAGQHLTLLNVPSVADVPAAVREIWWSANSDSALSYRQRVGQVTRPSIGVVVMSLLAPDVAGVMFTRNPVTGADERLIEASWGLGESVVSGRVIPDAFRIAASGEVLERRAGVKKLVIRPLPSGGTVEEEVPAERVEALCLDDGQLGDLHELATTCEQVYGSGRDIEWAFADGRLFLLQCRAVTSSRGSSASQATATPVVAMLPTVPLFADLSTRESVRVARLFKERRFAAGETVAKEGAGGAAFFIIQAGTAEVTVHGQHRATLGPGDHFGEIALLDEGARTATVIASTELVCQGVTAWDFAAMVRQNAAIGWKLLQGIARRYREAQEA